MKKKLSILLIITVMLFAFVPALTLAQDEETAVEEETDQISTELEEILAADYATVEEYLAALEENEMLSTVEKITLEKKLSSYEENLSMDSITSVVDKVLNKEIDLGQGFVILNNLEESTVNGYDEEKALEMINSYQNQENSGHLAFQTALELRKLSREDLSGEQTDAFSEQIAAIIEENGEIQTSELKQLAAEYRKEAREEGREQRKIAKSEKGNSASENALENGNPNKAADKDQNKDNKGKGNSNNSKAKDKSNGNSSGKSSNSNAKN
ncbi:hypothetical protein C8C77_101235 [Halanaerobium saccharolyticum]|uniref:DUF5667 domain-containing protein n=1 Tax=Halanaerobium saccharolyticum TaxID=43595 RepID=A0A4R7Z813_9FIRM|nr:hypothetical protein [Halanaerobium saccharolyticum]RAK11921.1 hypothetical protein C7958_102235 [Halanaerobium saccharolyticum]TDW07762.1 hypothetical protein C8C77_101235 [Halanaerobium saccharolyticum]TDX64683.1 hypothetical protein C7956_101235 [Halanaerobium saccharolyticum]